MPRKKGAKKDAKGKSTPGGEGGDQAIISLNDGWERIYNVGVKPFFDRVETIEDEDAFGIPQQQYILAYDTIFTMCIQREPYNHSSPLYQKHSEALTQHFQAVFVPALDKAKSQHSLVLLKEWVKRWRFAKWDVDGMTRMFMYLDRFHVPNSEDLLSTKEQGYTLFRQKVFEQFKTPAREAALDCIHREREGEEQDREGLRDAIAVFTELGQQLQKVELQIYKEDFHRQLVAASHEYYKLKSRTWMDQFSCPEYLVQAETCVQEEEQRLVNYIHKSSTDGLMAAVREELLQLHQDELLGKETGIKKMLERTQGADSENAKLDIARMYRLYQHVPNGLQRISDTVKQHVCDLGNGYIAKSKESQSADTEHGLVRNLIDLHDRFLRIVKVNFQNDQMFQKALKDAFEDFINKEYYTSSYLARFANDILKKGTKVAVADLENTMDHVVMLYGYIRDKDIFERDYQQYLAHRLLQDLSQSEQSERSMIGKLKTESGYHWTSKLEDMFKDIQRSKELMGEFQSAHGAEFDMELNVSVCTTGAWPTSSIPPVKTPADIVPISEKFRQFYLQRFSGRKLNFQMDKGKCEVQVAFNPKTRKILVVSTYQMMLLLLFNSKTTLKFKEILELTGIPRDECVIHLLSLAHPKIKVLRKAPNNKDCKDDHKFQINPKFANARAKINIPLLQKVKTPTSAEDDPGMEAIYRLRRHQMDAAIVRIMKARKTLKHIDLVSEVIKQLRSRFTPKPVDIKKRIQNLIELEYLERDENDRQLYHYKM